MFEWLIDLLVSLQNKMGCWIWGIFSCGAARSCSCCGEGCLCGNKPVLLTWNNVVVGVFGLWTPSPIHTLAISKKTTHASYVVCCCSLIQVLPMGMMLTNLISNSFITLIFGFLIQGKWRPLPWADKEDRKDWMFWQMAGKHRARPHVCIGPSNRFLAGKLL